jgi:cytochrome c oxidase subunit II
MKDWLAGSSRRWLLLTLLLALALAACSSTDPQNTMTPNGFVAEKLMDLWLLVFWLAAAVFVLVEGLLVYTVVRYRRRPGQPMPTQTHGHTVFEIGWTILPTLVLVGIGIPSVRVLFELDEPPTPPLEVEVVGHQWWWEFRYPAYNIVTASDLVIPVQQPVRVTLRSADVQHSFWVPRLAGKTDVFPSPPGTTARVNHMWFNADRPGFYSGQCAELCGVQHAQMRFYVVAQPQAEFDAWVRAQQAVPSQPTAGDAQRGLQAIQNGGCLACHTIEGTIAQAKVGPNLTHVASRSSLAGGILPNTPENLARWLRNPQDVKVGNLMLLPRPLTEDEIRDLVAYLSTLQ